MRLSTLWRPLAAALLLTAALPATAQVARPTPRATFTDLLDARTVPFGDDTPVLAAGRTLVDALPVQTFQATTFPPTGWTKFKTDTQTSTAPDWVRVTSAPCSAADACASATFLTAGPTARYLATPQITPSATAKTLTFRAGQAFTDPYGDELRVLISTTTATAAGFTTTALTLTEAQLPIGAFANFSVDLSAYVGVPIYIAFVHTQNDGDRVFIDDVAVAEPVAASFTSTTTTFQNTAAASRTQELYTVGANIIVGGNTGTTPLTSITFSTTGTTSTADLAQARVLYIGSSTSFSYATSPTFGTPIANPNGTLTFTGTQALTPGNNYFLLVYRVAANATPGNVVDGTYEGAIVGGTARTPTVTTLAGSSTIAAPPVNDNLASAKVVAATPYTDSQTNVGASFETGEAAATCTDPGADTGNSIWYSYTPSVAGSATFTSNGFDTIQTLYTGSTFPLTQVACADAQASGTAETFTVAVTAGTRYYFRVAGYAGTSGTAAVNITGPAPAISQQLSNGAGYRLLSAPVSGVTVGTLAGINLVQGVVGQYPGGTSTIRPNLFLDLTSAGYVAATDVANPVTPGAGFFWYFYDRDITPPSDASNGMGTSRSYTLATRPLAASGTPITANTTVTYPVSGNNTFHMAGNPFATSLTADGVTGDVAIQNVIQLYNPASGFVPQPRTAATRLSTWQGFIVEQTTAGTALTVTYDATKRVAGNGTIVGRTAGTQALAFVLSGQTADGTAVRDEAAMVSVLPDAAAGWDADDASKLVPPTDVYALLAPVGERDGAAYRQAVLSTPDASALVTLAFTATRAGTYTVTAEALGYAEGTAVEIRDLVTGTVTAIGEGYTFTSAATDWTERFAVHARTAGATAGEGEAATAFALAAPSPNPTTGTATVSFDVPAASDVSVAVYDLLGRRVAVLAEGQVAAGRHTSRLDAGALAPGVYVVRMQSGTFVATQRVTVVR